MKDFEDSGETPDGAASSGKQRKSSHDQLGKTVLATDADDMPVSELGIFGRGKFHENFVVAKSSRHELPIRQKTRVLFDMLFSLKLKEGAPPPPGFSRDAVELLIVELEEERRARDVAKHLLYAGAIFQEHYTSLEIDFRLHMTVIYGPKVNPKETARADFGCLVFRPELIFLADTDIGGLLSEAKEHLESSRKITRLQLYRLLSAPRIGETLDPELLRLCLG
ncbi:MAG: hypothetical protein LBW85_01940, partial [Deltaproteobacteria bacterium]|nr:hypothetical protein [Deltaproteobacteria bacterium]